MKAHQCGQLKKRNENTSVGETILLRLLLARKNTITICVRFTIARAFACQYPARCWPADVSCNTV